MSMPMLPYLLNKSSNFFEPRLLKGSVCVFTFSHKTKLLHIDFLGSNRGGEVENCRPRSSDFLSYARSARHAGRLHQVGYVCRERSL